MRAELPLPFASSDPQRRGAWLAHLVDRTDLAGWVEPVGTRHHGLYLETGRDLLVSFDQMEAICRQPVGQYPAAWQAAQAAGWSVVSLIAEGETGYRDRAVRDWVDRLADQAFFDDFDRVLFYGAGLAGHAACVFSVAAPGAAVLALSPVATLSPALAGWDRRYPGLRRQDYRSRYAYGPDLIGAAGAVSVICDPGLPEDAMHATLYALGGAQVLPARGAGARPGDVLEGAAILAPLLELAQNRSLTPAAWGRLWRNRRASPTWLETRAASASPARARLFLQQMGRIRP